MTSVSKQTTKNALIQALHPADVLQPQNKWTLHPKEVWVWNSNFKKKNNSEMH